MIQELGTELAEVIRYLTCSKGFDPPCNARDVGLHTFVECLEEDPDDCPFSMLLDGVHYCKCPLCIDIAKQLEK